MHGLHGKLRVRLLELRRPPGLFGLRAQQLLLHRLRWGLLRVRELLYTAAGLFGLPAQLLLLRRLLGGLLRVHDLLHSAGAVLRVRAVQLRMHRLHGELRLRLLDLLSSAAGLLGLRAQ